MYFNILDKTYDNEQFGGTDYTIKIRNELNIEIDSTNGIISKNSRFGNKFIIFQMNKDDNIFTILKKIFIKNTLLDCLFEITDDNNNFLLTFKSSEIIKNHNDLKLNKNLKIYIKPSDNKKHKNEITLISNDKKLYKRIKLNDFKKISYLSIYKKNETKLTKTTSIEEYDLIYSDNTIKDIKKITITNQLSSALTINDDNINNKNNTIIYYDTTNNIIDILKNIFKTYMSSTSSLITPTTLIEIQNTYGITFLFNDLKNNNKIYYNDDLNIWIKETQTTDNKINLIYIDKDNKMIFNKISKTDFNNKLLKTNFYYYTDRQINLDDSKEIKDFMMLYTNKEDNLYIQKSKMCKVILNISNTSSIIEYEIDNPETINFIDYLLDNDVIKNLNKEQNKEFYFKITIEGAVLLKNSIFYIPFIDLNTNNKFFLKKDPLNNIYITYSKIIIELLKDIDETIDNPIIDDKLYLWIFNKQNNNFDLQILDKNNINKTEYYFYDKNNKVLLTYCNYIPYRLVYNKEPHDTVIRIKNVNNLIKLYKKKLASENNDIIRYLYENMIGILQDPNKSYTASNINSHDQIIDLNSDDDNNNNNIILFGGSSPSIDYLDDYIELLDYINSFVNLFNINLTLTIDTSEISTDKNNIKFMELITGLPIDSDNYDTIKNYDIYYILSKISNSIEQQITQIDEYNKTIDKYNDKIITKHTNSNTLLKYTIKEDLFHQIISEYDKLNTDLIDSNLSVEKNDFFTKIDSVKEKYDIYKQIESTSKFKNGLKIFKEYLDIIKKRIEEISKFYTQNLKYNNDINININNLIDKYQTEIQKVIKINITEITIQIDSINLNDFLSSSIKTLEDHKMKYFKNIELMNQLNGPIKINYQNQDININKDKKLNIIIDNNTDIFNFLKNITINNVNNDIYIEIPQGIANRLGFGWTELPSFIFNLNEIKNENRLTFKKFKQSYQKSNKIHIFIKYLSKVDNKYKIDNPLFIIANNYFEKINKQDFINDVVKTNYYFYKDNNKILDFDNYNEDIFSLIYTNDNDNDNDKFVSTIKKLDNKICKITSNISKITKNNIIISKDNLNIMTYLQDIIKNNNIDIDNNYIFDINITDNNNNKVKQNYKILLKDVKEKINIPIVYDNNFNYNIQILENDKEKIDSWDVIILNNDNHNFKEKKLINLNELNNYYYHYKEDYDIKYQLDKYHIKNNMIIYSKKKSENLSIHNNKKHRYDYLIQYYNIKKTQAKDDLTKYLFDNILKILNDNIDKTSLKGGGEFDDLIANIIIIFDKLKDLQKFLIKKVTLSKNINVTPTNRPIINSIKNKEKEVYDFSDIFNQIQEEIDQEKKKRDTQIKKINDEIQQILNIGNISSNNILKYNLIDIIEEKTSYKQLFSILIKFEEKIKSCDGIKTLDDFEKDIKISNNLFYLNIKKIISQYDDIKKIINELLTDKDNLINNIKSIISVNIEELNKFYNKDYNQINTGKIKKQFCQILQNIYKNCQDKLFNILEIKINNDDLAYFLQDQITHFQEMNFKLHILNKSKHNIEISNLKTKVYIQEIQEVEIFNHLKNILKTSTKDIIIGIKYNNFVMMVDINDINNTNNELVINTDIIITIYDKLANIKYNNINIIYNKNRSFITKSINDFLYNFDKRDTHYYENSTQIKLDNTLDKIESNKIIYLDERIINDNRKMCKIPIIKYKENTNILVNLFSLFLKPKDTYEIIDYIYIYYKDNNNNLDIIGQINKINKSQINKDNYFNIKISYYNTDGDRDYNLKILYEDINNYNHLDIINFGSLDSLKKIEINIDEIKNLEKDKIKFNLIKNNKLQIIKQITDLENYFIYDDKGNEVVLNQNIVKNYMIIYSKYDNVKYVEDKSDEFDTNFDNTNYDSDDDTIHKVEDEDKDKDKDKDEDKDKDKVDDENKYENKYDDSTSPSPSPSSFTPPQPSSQESSAFHNSNEYKDENDSESAKKQYEDKTKTDSNSNKKQYEDENGNENKSDSESKNDFTATDIGQIVQILNLYKKQYHMYPINYIINKFKIEINLLNESEEYNISDAIYIFNK